MLKDIACRGLLRKLEQLGYIQLPEAIHENDSPKRQMCNVCKESIQPIFRSQEPIVGSLKTISPIRLEIVEKDFLYESFKYFISAYHYLGWSGTAGENLKYLIFDVFDRPLGCVMWGASAWKVDARDRYIGWNAETRMRNLSLVVNNNRFLILPWVEISHLASHILGLACRTLCRDWQKKYNHSICLAETFVEQKRFKGTCYKAANWIYVGQTKGRGRFDFKKQNKLPIKDVWLYPLDSSFRKILCT